MLHPSTLMRLFLASLSPFSLGLTLEHCRPLHQRSAPVPLTMQHAATSSSPQQRRTFVASGLATAAAAAAASSAATAAPGAAFAASDPPPLLRLTRAEISKKLARVPVFYVESALGGVVLQPDGSEGLFYLSKADADRAAAAARESAAAASGENSSKTPRGVALAFLNDVYFPLCLKSAKLEMYPKGNIVGVVVDEGNADVPFRVVPKGGEGGDVKGGSVPLYFIERIALKGADPTQRNSIQKPLFLSEEDCRRAWGDMLAQEQRKGLPPKQQQQQQQQQQQPAERFVAVNSASDAAGEGSSSSSGNNSGAVTEANGNIQPIPMVQLDLLKVITAMQRGKSELAGLPETEDMRVLEFFASNEAVSEARDLYADIKINAAARTSL